MVGFRLFWIIIFAVACVSQRVQAADRMTIPELLESPTPELINKGNDFLIGKHNPDSALLCYTIVTDRYNNDLSDSEKLAIAKVMHNSGMLSYEYFHDYASALESFNRAYAISRKAGDEELSGLLLERLGNVYTLCAQLSASKEVGARSTDLFIQSYMLARKNGDTRSVCRNVINLTSLALDRNNITSGLRLALEDFNGLLSTDSIPDRWIFTRLSAAGNHILKERYQDALDEFIALYSDLKSKNRESELIPQILENIVECCKRTGEYDKGLCYTDSLIDYSRSNSYLYDEAMAFRLRGELFSLTGDSGKAKSDSLRFFNLRDSIMGINQIKLIERMESIANMRQENRELIYERHKHEKQKIFFNMLLVLLAAIVIFSIVLYRRHRQLKESYLQLYRKLQEELKREDTQRLERSRQKTSQPTREQAPRTLTDEQNNEYKAKILRVMDNEDAIFSPDFSLDRMAEMTDIKPRTLSVAINEIFNKNFYELLNEYRVREACRRLSDQQRYGRLTIEAISQSVGYKSRTSLVNAFKRTTGLTPSEYQKLAASQNK